MKKIFTLLFLLLSFIGFSQKIVDRANGASTVVDSRLMAKLNFYAPRYTDTTQANLGANIGIDSCGALIYTYNTDSYWYRVCFPVKHWVQVGSGSSGGTNIYNADGALTADRVLSGSNIHSLTFDSLPGFGVFSYTDATNYTQIQQDPNEVSIINIHNSVDSHVAVDAGTVQIRAEDSVRISYPGTAPSIATLGDFKLQARSPTGGLVDYTGSAGAPFIDSLQLDSLMQRYGLSGWGDSFTAGFTQLVGGYPEFLANQAGRIMINNGVGGAVSQNILTFFLAGRDQWLRSTVIWSGYNNRDQATIIIANCSEMADSLIAHGNNRFLFLTIPNGPADSLVAGVPYTWYDSIIKVQTQLNIRYPGHVADVRGFLVSKYNPALPADVTAHNENQIPPSLRTDGVHLTTQGYYYVERYIDSLYGGVFYDRDYSTYTIDANRIINLTQGLLPNMGVQDLGAFYIGNMQYLYRPDRYNAPDNYIASNGGRLITTGSKNTTLGIGAGLALTTGAENTLLGYNVGKLLTTPSNNTFVGSSAGTNTTLGFNNVGVGYQVMLGTNAFARNTAIGNSSQRNVSDGTDNTSVGESSLAGNQDGLNNVVVGRAAASNGTSVNRMSIVGANNCTQCSVGDVVAMGYQAMFNNTAGTRNTVISQQGLFGNLIGNDNVTLGYRAAFGTNGFTMSEYRNTAIGTLAIGQIRNQANDNIGLGYRAIMDSITGSNNIAIGDSIDLPSRTGSDQGTIGNVIFLAGGMGHGQTIGAGRMGLGITSPAASALLDITSTSKGFLTPRMTTTQQNAISSPATGLLIFNTDSLKHSYYNGSSWIYYGPSGAGGGGGVTSVTGTSNRITSSGGTTPAIDIAATYVGQTSLTTLGTVTTGTLSTGAIIGGVTMTLGSDAANDVYYRNGSGILTRLANGTTGQFLAATTGSAPSWSTPSGGGSPGGSDTYVQFNRNGVFAGVDSLTWTSNGLDNKYRYRINGVQVAWLPNQTSFPSVMYIGNGTGFALAAGATLNTAVGLGGALGVNTTGASVTAIGSRSFQANTTGSTNTGVGDASGFSNVGGAGNTYVGKSAGQSNTGSSNIVAVGASAFLNNTAAQGIAIGATAGNANTSGPDNVLIGFQAGFQNSTGGQNVWVGTQAGLGVSSNNNSNNTGVGFKAGSGITTGKGNIFLGDSSGRTETSVLRSIVIGTNAGANGDFSLNLGNAIWGTGMTGTGTTPAGSIGIGVVAPAALLHLLGTTEQLRTGFDASNYYSTTVGSAGGVTFNAVGSSSGFTFSDGIGVNATASTAFAIAMGGSGYTSGVFGMVAPSVSATAGSSPALGFFGGTIIEAGSGTHTYIAGVNIDAPTITGGVATVTDAATLRIAGATSATVTGTNSAILVTSGVSRFLGGTQTGSTGQTLLAQYSNSATLDFGSTAASSSTDLTITVTGAADGDPVTVTPPNGSVAANSIYTAWVSSANTITVRFSNLGLVSALDPASGTFRAVVQHY